MNEHHVIITLFTGKSCPACQALKHRLSLWHQDHQDVFINSISIDEQRDIAGKYGVLSVPTIIVFIDKKETIRVAGYFSLDHLLDQVERYLRLL